MSVVGEAAHGRAGLDLVATAAPDVVLLDLRLPGVGGVEVIRLLREKNPAVRVLALTTVDQEEEIFRAVEAGARGYLLKDMRKEELLDAIRAVHQGDRWIAPVAASRLAERVTRKKLSDRELEILALLTQGKTNKEIAGALALAEDTIKWHMKSVLDKLGTHDRTQAAVVAIQRGLVRV